MLQTTQSVALSQQPKMPWKCAHSSFMHICVNGTYTHATIWCIYASLVIKGLSWRQANALFVRRRWSFLTTLCWRRAFPRILLTYRVLTAGLPQASSAITRFVQLLPSLYPGLRYHGQATSSVDWEDLWVSVVQPVCRSLLEAVAGVHPCLPWLHQNLNTDVSNDEIVAFLSQKDDSRETVVAYASRVLSKANKRYKERAAGCCDIPSTLPPISPRTPLHSKDRPWIPHRWWYIVASRGEGMYIWNLHWHLSNLHCVVLIIATCTVWW